jgi:hypothetical protein
MSVNGARTIFQRKPILQLPKRCTARVQNPCSKQLPSWVRRSSRSWANSPIPGGLRLRSPFSSGGASRLFGMVILYLNMRARGTGSISTVTVRRFKGLVVPHIERAQCCKPLGARL